MSGSPMTPQVFAAKWRGAQLSERAAVQEHFLDLCALFGQPTPASADPTPPPEGGARYLRNLLVLVGEAERAGSLALTP